MTGVLWNVLFWKEVMRRIASQSGMLAKAKQA